MPNPFLKKLKTYKNETRRILKGMSKKKKQFNYQSPDGVELICLGCGLLSTLYLSQVNCWTVMADSASCWAYAFCRECL